MERSYTAGELATVAGAELHGDPGRRVRRLAPVDGAGPDDVSFVLRPDEDVLASCRAGVLILPRPVPGLDVAQIVAGDVALAAALVHNHMLARPFEASGVHPAAVIGPECEIDGEVSIAAGVVIGRGVKIGPRVAIGANSVVGDGCVIGSDTVIHANVTLYERVEIGARVILHSGCVIGADGFGFATAPSGEHVKKPHVGNVVIEDDVEIGANCCVDRAYLGETRVRRGVKTDNHVHIGHNADVGENCLLVGQVAIGGSVVIGRNCVFAGQVGVKDHVRVGDRVMAGGKTGIHCDQPDGAVVSGMPAIPHRQWLRAVKVFARLPEIERELRRIGGTDRERGSRKS